MRAIEIPKFRAVSSGLATYEGIFGAGGFADWTARNSDLIATQITDDSGLMWHEGDRHVLIRPLKENVSAAEVEPYDVFEFPGGMFLVATCNENDNDDLEETVGDMHSWISESGVFEYGDFPRSGMSNMPNPYGLIDKALGISQQQIFLPLKFRQVP